MASDDSDVEPQLSESERRDLERVAYSRPRTKRDAAAAEDALRRLLAADPAPAAPRASVLEPAQPIAAADDPEPDFDDDEPPAPRRRSLIPLLVVVGLVIGAGSGVLVARGSPMFLIAAATPSATPTPSARAAKLTDSAKALAELASPQSEADKFPVGNFADSLDLEKTSIHRILTTSDGVTLWIGKSTADICMIYTTVQTPIGSNSGATCASVSEFGDTGLSLHFGDDMWTWHGGGFTTMVTQ